MNFKPARSKKTDKQLTGRAGLSLFIAYLHSINIFPLLDRFFKIIRESQKDIFFFEIFRRGLCFTAVVTSRHVSCLEHLIKDGGYAGSIETAAVMNWPTLR